MPPNPREAVVDVIGKIQYTAGKLRVIKQVNGQFGEEVFALALEEQAAELRAAADQLEQIARQSEMH